MGRSTRVRTAAAVAVALAALAGCGGSDTAAPTTGGSSKALSSASLQTLLDYTGSKAGKADPDATPVTIGWLNQEGGPAAFPQFTTQTEDAVRLVNEQMGGIDGHPLKLVTCIIVSAEEQGQKCGQQFANDAQLRMVVQGPLINGAAPFHAVVDKQKIPVTGGYPLAVADNLSRNSFYLSSGVYGTVPDFVYFAKNILHAQKIALITLAGDPVSGLVARQMRQGFGLSGLQVKQAQVAQGQTDATASLAAADAQNADLIIPLVISAAQCLGMANTLKRAGLEDKPTLALYGCATESVAKQFGDYPRWYYGAGLVSELAPAANPTEQAQVDAYKEWFQPLKDAGDETSGVGQLQGVLTAVKFLNDSGGADASRASIIDAASAWKGPIFLGPPDVDYGGIPILPALPSLALRFYQYTGDGTWLDAADGQWIAGKLGEAQ